MSKSPTGDAAEPASSREECSCCSLFKFVLESRVYEIALAMIIITNSVFIIQEVDMRAQKSDTKTLEKIGWSFLAFYVVEIGVRIAAYREHFFHSTWNLFDLTVVVIDAIGQTADIAFGDRDDLPSLSVFRVLRLFRLARSLRVVSMFKELHMMLHAFLNALRTIFWAFIVLAILLSLWSIVAVEVVHDVNLRVYETGVYGHCPRCERAFESVLQANLTFMQTIVAGDSWGQLALPIIEESPLTAIVLIGAFVTVHLGVLNLILTVIVNAAHEARESDEKLRAAERMNRYRSLKRRLLKIGTMLDEDQNDLISKDEMYRALEAVPEFRVTLESMDIRRDDIDDFFAFLDTDSSGQITYKEFVEQVSKMKSRDTAGLIVNVQSSVSKLSRLVQDHFAMQAPLLHSPGAAVGLTSSAPPSQQFARQGSASMTFANSMDVNCGEFHGNNAGRAKLASSSSKLSFQPVLSSGKPQQPPHPSTSSNTRADVASHASLQRHPSSSSSTKLDVAGQVQIAKAVEGLHARLGKLRLQLDASLVESVNKLATSFQEQVVSQLEEQLSQAMSALGAPQSPDDEPSSRVDEIGEDTLPKMVKESSTGTYLEI